MIGRDPASAAPAASPAPLRLEILLLTADERLARRVDLVCRTRGHDASRLERLRDLRAELIRRVPDVLVLDASASVAETAGIATRIASENPSIRIALATVGPKGRSARGFRLIDVRRPRERVADELELAYIGIPASVHDAHA